VDAGAELGVGAGVGAEAAGATGGGGDSDGAPFWAFAVFARSNSASARVVRQVERSLCKVGRARLGKWKSAHEPDSSVRAHGFRILSLLHSFGAASGTTELSKWMQLAVKGEHALYGSVAKVAHELHVAASPPSGTQEPPLLELEELLLEELVLEELVLEPELLEPELLGAPELLLVELPLLLDAPLSGPALLLLEPHAVAAIPPEVATRTMPAIL
jgi:hypothetical protein